MWGRVAAGSAPNAIPDRGEVEGTLRCLDAETWASAPMLVRQLADTIVAPYGASAEVTYLRGVPPVDNEAGCAEVIAEAARCTIGPAAVVSTPQSLGGEDFAWYLEHIPGALGRLGTASRRHRHRGDLHQGSFDVDEAAIEQTVMQQQQAVTNGQHPAIVTLPNGRPTLATVGPVCAISGA